MIITRYLSKEIFAALLAATFILTLIFVGEQFLSYLRAASHGSLTLSSVLLLLSLQVPVLLTTLLPLSLFLSILLAYGRLYVDSEMTVLAACGVPNSWLFGVALRFALIITILVAVLSLWVAPKMEEISTRLYAANEAKAMQLLIPGRFSSLSGGKWIFYVEEVSKDKKHLRDVFAAEMPAAKKTPLGNRQEGIIFAKGGYYKTDAFGNEFLVLTDGSRYLGKAGRKDYQIIQFEEYGMRLDQKKNLRLVEKTLPTNFLWRHLDQKKFLAEFNWRIALPIATLVLMLFAVPLSKISLRRGRYAAFGPAVLFYILYANLLLMERSWLIKGGVAPIISMWWVHALMLFLATILILVSYKK